MAKIGKAAKTVAHVTIFSLTVHCWHLVTSDRMMDAIADVGLDKAADIALVTLHVEARQ